MHRTARRTIERGIAAILLATLTWSCGGSETGASSTQFLTTCESTCPGGMACLCGVCTAPCTSDERCVALHPDARCAPTNGTCGANVASACQVACAGADECARFSPSLECIAGSCASGVVEGTGGQGNGGSGGSGTGGGAPAGGASGAGAGGAGGAGSGCGVVGASCCDPFPGDGPNYCVGGLFCGVGNQCYPDTCECALGAYIPACGVDGVSYDATCGRECVPVEIACNGECPCSCTADTATGCAPTTGAGSPCCAGLQCCQGIPYDTQGECHPTCELRSDRAAKTDVSPADAEQLLESVARLPISTWRYVSDPAPLHVGPMAQDFAAEFGLGGDPRVIAAVDASGVALASIQALHQRVERLAEENAELRRRLEGIESGSARGVGE